MCYAGRKVSVEAPRSAPSAPQKKTADTTTPIKQAQPVASAPAPPAAPAPSPTPTVQESTPMKVVSNDPPKETPAPAVVPAPEMTPVIKEETKVPQAGLVMNTPTLSSVEDLLKAAEANVAKESDNKIAVNLEDTEEIWSAYVAKCESPTTSGILKNVFKEVVDDKIKVYVPTNIAREEIQQETDLYTEIREHFKKPGLEVIIQVDRDRFPDLQETNTQKRITPKEKYDHLKTMNPLIDKLIERLDLKLDE